VVLPSISRMPAFFLPRKQYSVQTKQKSHFLACKAEWKVCWAHMNCGQYHTLLGHNAWPAQLKRRPVPSGDSMVVVGGCHHLASSCLPVVVRVPPACHALLTPACLPAYLQWRGSRLPASLFSHLPACFLAVVWVPPAHPSLRACKAGDGHGAPTYLTTGKPARRSACLPA
jgi:hypothetical protein